MKAPRLPLASQGISPYQVTLRYIRELIVQQITLSEPRASERALFSLDRSWAYPGWSLLCQAGVLQTVILLPPQSAGVTSDAYSRQTRQAARSSAGYR